MKKIVFLLITFSIILFSCDKEVQLINDVVINRFEVIPDTTVAPTKVLVIVDWKTEKQAIIDVQHQGAYKSLNESDTSNFSYWGAVGKWAFIDTIKLYYLKPGNYDVILKLRNRESYFKSFTLQ